MNDDRSARLAARSEALREKTTRRRQALEWAEQRTAAVRGSAASGDGLVRATVDSTGLLTGLELAAGVRAAKPAELARVITVVVRRAAAHARGQVAQTYEGLRNEGVLSELPAGLLPAPDDGPVTLLAAPAGTPPQQTDSPILRPANDTRPPDRRAAEQRARRSDEDEGPPSSWLVRPP
ncbi:YbaB/EbfC family nucleoid-associated protein [Amycolatopsis nigrescens]|uniref:YbaB/EbfC family nucleoid-associated protein n=1 Tax=Amycolatopsis nigrescens TaxID=381445 RepID=UPI000367293A|nr:YbaB/EbfC family nucleoid-associated protein [Amycolatopsis nigrescens]